MKEYYMQNGQLKPGYNVQVSSESQFVIHYMLHQVANDLNTLKPHLNSFKELYRHLPGELTADAGYGSEENYDFLEGKNIMVYVKYSTFDKEQGILKSKRKKLNEDFLRDRLYYDEEKSRYICPMGQPMNRTAFKNRRIKTGYVQKTALCQVRNCDGCPLRELATRRGAKGQ